MGRFLPLLDLDADLGEAIPAAELADARRLATVPVVTVPAGPCDFGVLESEGAQDAPFAALVTSGLLVHSVELGERVAAQLIGAGDVVVPWGRVEPPATGSALTAPEPVRMALLDRRLLLITRRWPQIGAALLLRAHQQVQRAAVQQAISQLSRVEDRVLAMLWHLAQRWGTVMPEGTVVALELTHETLGRLVGARRPTVTLALTALASGGSVVRSRDGGWLLPGTRPVVPLSPALAQPDLVRLIAGGVVEALRDEQPAIDPEALLERISALRASQQRTAELVARSLRQAEAVRLEAADLRARFHARAVR